MNDQNDSQLLRAYAESRSEPAFAELVHRHVNMVYSAARRMVYDPHLAEDVTQGVFLALANSSSKLTDRPVISGWLHRTTQNIAAQTVRTIERRRAREQEAFAMNELVAVQTEPDWEQIAPHLDTGLDELSEPDRDALMLRYFERKSAQEMAQTLGISDEAAQKRVSRAVDRLRELLVKRGVTVGAGGLIAVVSANAVQAAPAGLAATISTVVIAGSSLITTTLIATHTTMNWLTLKTAAAVIVAAISAGTATYFVNQSKLGDLQNENQRLVAQQDTLTKERDNAVTAAAANHEEVARLKKNQAELPRLRGEVGQLRRQLESQKSANATPPPSTQVATATAGHPPGTYIGNNQLADAGYATPEAGLETMTWAMMHGSYDQVNKSLLPEMLTSELKDPKGRQDFETRQAQMAGMFKGMQIVARKALPDGKVELKVKMDYDAETMKQFSPRPPPEFMLQPMVKVGDEWKIGGSTHEYKKSWDANGDAQAYVP